MELLYYGLYLALLGSGMFLLGRVLPKELFHHDRGHWRCFTFEKEEHP